jgi:hypothetical protein
MKSLASMLNGYLITPGYDKYHPWTSYEFPRETFRNSNLMYYTVTVFYNKSIGVYRLDIVFDGDEAIGIQNDLSKEYASVYKVINKIIHYLDMSFEVLGDGSIRSRFIVDNSVVVECARRVFNLP